MRSLVFAFALFALLPSQHIAAQENSVVSKPELENLKKQMSIKQKEEVQWEWGGRANFNFAQAAFSHWAGGGDNSVALGAVLNLFSRGTLGAFLWENSLDIGYGFLVQESTGYRKTDDKLEFVSKLGRRAFNQWSYSALLNFRSQMTPGYQAPGDSVKISDFLSPAYISLAVGLNSNPDAAVQLFASPLTGKITIVSDQQLADAGAYGVEPAVYDSTGKKVADGKNLRGEFGGSAQLIANLEVMENVQYKSVLSLFSNYLRNPQNVDVLWDHYLTFQINKYLSTVLTVNFIYDDDVKIGIDENDDGNPDRYAPRLQIKEVLGIGFTVKI